MNSRTVRSVRASWLSLAALMGGCLADAAEPDEEAVETPDLLPALSNVPEPEKVDLLATRDTSLDLRNPNQNEGAGTTLAHGLALVAFDHESMMSVLTEQDVLVSATLHVQPVAGARSFFSLLSAYRMTSPWTELGATYHCANDADTSNRSAECSGADAWSIGLTSQNPWMQLPSAIRLFQGTPASVELDVTRDVERFLSGQSADEGWMLLGVGFGSGAMEFQSREGSAPPVLTLSVRRCSATLCDDGNSCTTDLCDEHGLCLHEPLADGASCSDGDACTQGDQCSATQCVPGEVVTCGAGAQVVINEVESSGGVPGDWIELYNAGDHPVDISGWVLKDNDDGHAYPMPAGSVLVPDEYVVIEEAQLGFGLGGGDAARLFDAQGSAVDSYVWTSHAAITYARCPNGTGDFRDATRSTKGTENDCSPPPPCTAADAGCKVVVNEVESNNGSPGDWIELFNPGKVPVDLSGWIVKDNDDSHNYAIASGTVLGASEYLVVEEAQLGFGLGSADSARVFAPSGALIDSYAWTSHAAVTYGRCPNGSGDFATATTSTKGAANDCVVGPSFSAWPGSNTLSIVDSETNFASNLSGLSYEPGDGSHPALLWGVQNGPSLLWRLTSDGSLWTPDTSEGWSLGKTLLYPTGTGSPDAEGMTRAEWNSAAVYVVTERDNDNKDVSRISILRFDTAGGDSALTATHEWNLTADLPASGANTGAEAITWVPDSYLVAHAFRDESRAATYDPSVYPNHGTGIFLVGLESVGTLYAYVLDHSAGTFQRIATVVSGQPMSIDLSFDRDVGQLWSYCDDACGNRSTILRVDDTASSPSYGKFILRASYERPAGMANLANEGIAISSEAECSGGSKPFFWADDSDTDGHSLREGAVQCGALP